MDEPDRDEDKGAEAGESPLRRRLGLAGGIAAASGTAIVLLAACTTLKSYRIPSSNMEPTLRCARPGVGCSAERGDRILVRRFLPGEDPGRGDVIAFDTPPATLERCGAGGTFVKRVIGLPGERVVERAGVIRIDGRELDEPYVVPTNRDSFEGAWVVADDYYFVLGDNRRNSCDSRIWGAVPRDDVIGKVIARYWPPGRIGRLR